MPSLGRVIGLKDLVAHTNCSSSNALILNTSHDWPVYVSPGILLLLYYTVTSLLKLRAHHPPDQVGAHGQLPSSVLPHAPPDTHPHLGPLQAIAHGHGQGGELSSALVSADKGSCGE